MISARICRGVSLTILLIVAAAWMLLPVRMSLAQPDKKPEQGVSSIYCGPRCVQRVLREYDIEVDLLDLIREIQWPAAENGSSLKALTESLEKRGVSARAVDLDPRFAIEWAHPAIVHLEDEGSAHYVVWIPARDRSSAGRVWDHDVTKAVKAGQFDSLRTGPVLLTSNRPIPDSAVLGRRIVTESQFLRRSVYVVLLAISGFGSGWFLKRYVAGTNRQAAN